jgi:hypothetical protein
MWQINLRFRRLSLCQPGLCPACDFAPRAAARHDTLPGPCDFQSLKADFTAMTQLRDILRQVGNDFNIQRIDDDAVVRQVSALLASGRIRLCGRDGNTGLDDDHVADPELHSALRAAHALQEALGTMSIRGRDLRVIASSQWKASAADEGFEIVPVKEARTLLGDIVSRSPQSRTRSDALDDVLGRVSADPLRPLDGALVVVSRAPAPPTRNAPPESAITPDRFAKALAAGAADSDQKVHWVEIEVVDEDGVGVPDQDYVIVAPDKSNYTGQTDTDGLARVDGISAGQCWVSFPKIDRSAWFRT